MTERATSGAVAPIAPPSLETFRRHESNLVTWDYEETDDRGNLVTRFYPLPRVDRYTRLINEADCRAIIAELEAALQPADYDQARALARQVIGRYSRRELIDPDVYVVEITRAFAEAPADIGQKAADRLRSLRFLPNVGDVTAALSPLVAERRRALDQVRRHLAEHQRRQATASAPKPETYKDLTPGERQAFDTEMENVVRRGARPRPLAEILGRPRK